MEEIIIHEKKKKENGPLAAGLVMIAGSVYIIHLGRQNGGIFYLLLGTVGVLFFGFCLFYAVAGRVKERTLLVMGAEGITDTSSAAGAGFIPYSEIQKAAVFQAMKETYVGIWLKDTERYVEQLPAGKRNAVRANLKLNCPPVCLRLGEAKEMTTEEIASYIARRAEKWQEERELS